ncbi:MAG: DUF5050 domain-containing protein [Oscillospiraceae bacterium]|nr:DUF5050 domain-containing protein [Oscillospiraceae bacterium]
MKNLAKKTRKLALLIVCVGVSGLLFACNHYVGGTSEESKTPSINTVRGLNQNNNIQYWGFAVMVEEYIFLADGLGIHRTDRAFEKIETLVLHETFHEDPAVISPGSMEYLAMFSDLQYYDNRVYFLDRRTETIYSMNLDGSELTQVLSASEITYDSRFDGFIVAHGKIFFGHFYPISLKSFDLETREITTYGTGGIFFSINPDGSELHFSYDFALFGLNLKNGTIEDRMPHNIRNLPGHELGVLGIITNRTASSGRIFFSTPHWEGSRIFVINDDGLAEEIYFNEGMIRRHINSVGEWIYFTVMAQGDENRQHDLYRIRNDGSGVELVHENFVSGTDGVPSIFINMFCEDIILFKISPTFHDIYALIRNPDTGEFERKHINPIS